MNEHKIQTYTIEGQKEEAPTVSRSHPKALCKVQVWLGGNDWGDYRKDLNPGDAEIVKRVAEQTYHLRARVIREDA